MRLLVCDDDVDVIAAAQTMVGHGQQRVDVRWQVDAGHPGVLVDHDIEEAGILVGKTIMVMAPYCGCDQQIQ